MKNLISLAIALLSFGGAANAATVDDLEVLIHNYVLVCDELEARPGMGVLFGANHFLDVYSGGGFRTNKGTVDLSVVNGNDGYVTQEIVNKYGADYGGPHYNCLRLKNAQDVIAMKLIAGTKLILFIQGNNKSGTEARIPKISKNADMSNPLNEAPGENHPATVAGFRWEYTVADDGLYYIGSYNGDMFVSFIIVEVNSLKPVPIEDVTHYIQNAGFDEDLTWQADGSKKTIVDQSTTLDDRSIVGQAADGSLYALVNPTTTHKRPDGRTLEATNGFISAIRGWETEIPSNKDCDWVYFGTVPYNLGAEAVPIADDGTIYLTVPEKPTSFSGNDNKGMLYLRCSWGNERTYSQEVELPSAVYRLEYWTININPTSTAIATDISKVTCQNDVFSDKSGNGISAHEWTKHEIEFAATSECTIDFGFRSAMFGSNANPIICLDGVKLYKISEIQKCAPPTIAYKGNELTFCCETEDADFVYDIKESEAQTFVGNKVKMNPTITVSVYAKKDGYVKSEVVTKEIELAGLKGDINGDGKVDATDITHLIKKLLGKKSTPLE